jgi:hypothetical protein
MNSQSHARSLPEKRKHSFKIEGKDTAVLRLFNIKKDQVAI